MTLSLFHTILLATNGFKLNLQNTKSLSRLRRFPSVIINLHLSPRPPPRRRYFKVMERKRWCIQRLDWTELTEGTFPETVDAVKETRGREAPQPGNSGLALFSPGLELERTTAAGDDSQWHCGQSRMEAATATPASSKQKQGWWENITPAIGLKQRPASKKLTLTIPFKYLGHPRYKQKQSNLNLNVQFRILLLSTIPKMSSLWHSLFGLEG